MTNMNTGVATFGSAYRTINISENRIFASNYGVRSYVNGDALELNISKNEITIDAGTANHYSAAIDLAEHAQSSIPNRPVILENDIEIVNGLHAIALNSTVSADVASNTIILDDALNDVNGIYSYSTKGSSISYNTITGTGPENNKQKAVNVFASTFNLVHGNITDATLYGLYFAKDCDATYMTCNDIGEHSWGGMLDDYGKFGHPHILSWNIWKANTSFYPVSGFEYKGIPGNAINERFLVNDLTATGGDPLTRAPGAIPTSQFFPIPGNNSCIEPSDPPDIVQVFDSVDYKVARGTLQVEEYNDEYLYMAQTNLYNKCELYPDSIPAESAIDSFYTANQNTSIGKFAALAELSKNLFSQQTIDFQTIIVSDSLTKVILKEISIKDSFLYSGISYLDSLELIDEKLLLKDSLNLILKISGELMSIIDSLNIIYSDSLLSENSNISVSTTIEQNQKNLNEVILNTLYKGIYEFDSAQKATIYDIATQCFLSGGKAVPIAQGVFRIINDTIVFANDTNCTEASPRMAKNEIIYENSYVFPSPSSDAATLKYKISDNSEATCIVYDVLSRKVIKFPLSPKKTEYRFSVEKINEGIYYYKIISNGNLKGFGKFSVIR